MVWYFLLCTVSPFNEANFVSLPRRSISVLHNPAGIGINTGVEMFVTFHSTEKNAGLVLGNLGCGIVHTDAGDIYELGTGIKLPGAFAIGFAREFGDTTENIIGVICLLNRYLGLGLKTNLARKKYVHCSANAKLFADILTLAGGVIYEGIENSRDYRWGIIVAPQYGVKINLFTDIKSEWHAGCELGTSKLKLSGIYSYPLKKFSFGLILSAQDY
ncbi:MAG: hypothetical protein ABIL40_04145 [candidate division WOR-3 bacterium]